MTVRELIAELQKLEQDRGIWVFYDGGFAVFPPIPDDRADAYDEDCHAVRGVKEGDYIINAS